MRIFELKYCFLILIFVCFLSFNLSAGTTYYYKVTANAAKPAGAGKVYVSDESNSINESDYSSTAVTIDRSSGIKPDSSPTFYFFAKTEGDFNYVQWKSGTTIINQGKLANGTHTFSIGPELSTTSGKPTILSYTPNFSYNYITANWDATRCTNVAVSPLPNSLNQNVKLTATLEAGYAIVGWRKVGENDIVAASSRQNPWTVKATEVVTYEPVLESSWVKVSSNDLNCGIATIDNPNNYEGNLVTMFAMSNSGKYYDVAWYKDGQLVSNDNPYTITVTERAEYVAHFNTTTSAPSAGYYRLRSANPATSNHVISLEDNMFDMQKIVGSASSFKVEQGIRKAETQLAQDIKMRDLNQAYTLPSTVVYLKPNGTQFNFFVQGTHIKQLSQGSFYGTNAGEIRTDGAYVDMSAAKNIVSIGMTISARHVKTGLSDELGPIHFADNGGNLIVTEKPDSRSAWYLEPISLENNYFAVQPDAQITLNGKFYTTFRTSFPCQIPEGTTMKVYRVTEVSTASGGIASLVAYQPGEVVPAGMPVVIESFSLRPEDNKLMPVNDPEDFISTNTSYSVSTALYNNYGAHRHDFGRYCQANTSKTDRVPMSGDQVGYFKLNPDYPDYDSNTVQYFELSVNEQGAVGFWNEVTKKTKTVSSSYSGSTVSKTFSYPELDGNKAYSTIPCALFEDVTTTINLSKERAYVGENILATIDCVAEGATIQYSLDDGSTWNNYSEPFYLSNNTARTFTIQAKATKGYSESVLVTRDFTFETLATPIIDPESATANVGTDIIFAVTKVSTDENVVTQYSLDNGSTWQNVVNNQITISSNVVGSGAVLVRNFIASSSIASATASATYDFKPDYTDITLVELLDKPVDDTKYIITDLTAVDVVDDELIICKDDNGYANPDAMPNPIPEGQTWVDYIAQSKASIEKDLDGREGGPDVAVPATYDQSNWIALHLPEGKHVTSVTDWQGRQLTGVKGRLLNKTNPEFQLDAMPTPGEDVTIAPNVYVAASFNGYNHQQGTKAPFIGTEYFFVQPKPMELATIGWAQWDAANKQFVVPANENQPEWNTAGLSGHFGFNGSLLEQQEGNASLLQDGHSYLMPALIKYKVGGNSQPVSAPRRAGEVAKEYVAYPLRLVQTTKELNGVITGVTAIGGSRVVAGVDYYNLAGQRSSRPWQGVNIVVTRYSDGTTSTCKQIKN